VKAKAIAIRKGKIMAAVAIGHHEVCTRAVEAVAAPMPLEQLVRDKRVAIKPNQQRRF
jgi:hypothetical protein